MKKRGLTALLLALSLVLGLLPMASAVNREDLRVNEQNKKYGVVDKAGNVVIPIIYDYVSIEENGTIKVYVYGEKGETQGLYSWEGKEILPAIYKYIWPQEDGSLNVEMEILLESGESQTKCGLLDPQGKELLPMIYDSIDGLSEGRRRVYLNGKAGYMDENFQVVIPFRYDYALPFEQGLAQVGRGALYGVIDPAGNEILPCAYNEICIYEGGLIVAGLYSASGAHYGLFDREGKEILPMEYDEIRNIEVIFDSDFGEYFVVVKYTETERRCGVVDRQGNEKVPMIYDYITRPAEDCWIVFQGEKMGALDGNFQMMIPLTADYESMYYHDGAFEVRRNEKWGVIDRSGKVLIPLIYDGLRSNWQGEETLFCKVEKDGKQGVLSYPDGKVLLPVVYDSLNIYGGLTTAFRDGHWGVLETETWETVVPFAFDGVSTDTYGMNGNILVIQNGLYGAYDREGNELFPCQFPTEERLRGAVRADSADPGVVETGSEEAGLEVTWYPEAAYLIRRYGTDRMLLVQDGKSGLFGLDGTKYTDFIFDAVGEFDQYGQAPAAKNGKWGKIDLNGDTVLDFICDSEQEVELGVKFVGPKGRNEPPYALVKTDGTCLTDYKYWAVDPFSGGLARVADGVSWTYLTPEGTEIYPFGRYSWVMEDFGTVNDGYVIVKSRENGETVCNAIDKTGQEIFPPVAQELWRAGEGMWGYRDRETGLVGFLDQSTGQIAIPAQYNYYIGVTGKVSHMMGNHFHDGVATVYQITTGEDYRVESFCIDTQGNRVEEPEGEPYVPTYYEGLLKVSRWDGFEGPGAGDYGFVNEAGEVVVPFLYDDAGEFDQGYASVRKNGVYGLLRNPVTAAAEQKALAELDILWLDGAEGELTPLGSDQLVTDFVVRGYGRWHAPYGDYGLWSVEGEHLLTADQAGAAGGCPRGPSGARIYAMSEEKVDGGENWEDTRYTDILGRTYLESELWDWDAPWNPPELDCSRAVNPETNRIEDGKYFYADPWTGEIVLPAIYDEAASFSDGIGIVAIGDDRFAIDRTGARLFDLNQYDELTLSWFEGGRLRVKDKETGKQGYLDKTGTPIGEGLVWDDAGGFYKGAAAVCREGRWGIIDLEGNQLIPCVFDDISGFENGIATVTLNGRQGILRDPRYKDKVSDWAQAEVAAATAAGYVTESCREYQTFTITRRQFAQLAVNYLEKATGETIDPAPADTFTDTADETVLKAYAAGIVQGVGEDKFSPGGLLTREQLATMLWRAMSKAGMTEEAPADLADYTDGGEVSSWAGNSLSALVGLNVMAGTGDNRLSPKDSCTVEQAVLLVLRAAK